MTSINDIALYMAQCVNCQTTAPSRESCISNECACFTMAKNVIRQCVALSQPAVAGAVDVVSVGEIRELAVKEYPGIHPPSAEMRDAFENGFISAVNHLRTASPSQPAAEELCEGCPEIGYPTDETRCTPCPRRASPADDGETKADVFTRGVAAGMKMAREIDDKMDDLLGQQDKQS